MHGMVPAGMGVVLYMRCLCEGQGDSPAGVTAFVDQVLPGHLGSLAKQSLSHLDAAVSMPATRGHTAWLCMPGAMPCSGWGRPWHTLVKQHVDVCK